MRKYFITGLLILVPLAITAWVLNLVISTMDGGMVSVCAPVADSSATSSPSFAPRFFISGNSAGAMAAMSAALDPEMPETRYMAPIST